jgi:hypothetical protein
MSTPGRRAGRAASHAVRQHSTGRMPLITVTEHVGARVMRTPGPAEAAPSIRMAFDGPGQRNLAAALSDQATAAILVVDGRGGWPARVELRLGDESRRLIRDAAGGRGRGR